MGERHTLRIAGAARGVLDEGEVVGRARRQVRHGAGLTQLGDRNNACQGRTLARQCLGEQPRARIADEPARTGVGEDASNAAQMIFELCRPGRRIKRHRHAAGIQRPIKRGEEIQPGGQHQGDAAARRHTARQQAGGDRLGGSGQPGVADRLVLPILAEQDDVTTLGLVADMPVEHLGQGDQCVRRRHVVCKSRRWRDGSCDRHRRLRRGANQRQQVGGRLGGEGRLAQPHAQFALDAGKQLDACQTIETEIALQMSIPSESGEVARGGFHLLC